MNINQLVIQKGRQGSQVCKSIKETWCENKGEGGFFAFHNYSNMLSKLRSGRTSGREVQEVALHRVKDTRALQTRETLQMN